MGPDAIFATKPLSEWGPLFDAEGVWWCPVQDPEEVAADEQAIAAGACVSPIAAWLLSPVGRQPTCRLSAQQLCSLLSAPCALSPGSNSVGCADSLTSQPAKRTRRPAARTSSPSRRPSTSSAAPPPRASPVRPNAHGRKRGKAEMRASLGGAVPSLGEHTVSVLEEAGVDQAVIDKVLQVSTAA